jgi:hypothetical protein
MAITHVSSTAIAFLGSATSYTISHAGGVCDSAYVFVWHISNTITGVTYGGVAMTKIAEVVDANSHYHQIWGLQHCYGGTQDAVISSSDAVQTRAGVITLKGTHKTATFPNVANTGLNNGVPPLSVSVTTTVDDCILLGIGGHNGISATAVLASTGTTEISAYDGGGSSDGVYKSNPLVVGVAGSYSLEVTSGTNFQDLSLAVVAISPNNRGEGISSPIII